MNTVVHKVLLLCCVFIALFSHNSAALDLTVVSDHAPPHIIEPTRNGIDVDITLAVLQKIGHSPNLRFMPLKRGRLEVLKKNADLFLPTFYESDSKGLFISDAIIEYRPTFFTRSNEKLAIKSIADLANKRIVTFQGASQYFGDEFLAMTQRNKNYREVSSMSVLPLLLMKERYDVVLLDYYIFYYFLKAHRLSDVKEHVIFDSVDAHVGFNDVDLRNNFNDALSTFKHSEEYHSIIRKYLPHY
ncbi:MAG: substrate-binding periplasmic protein [Psychrobium sp.]